MAEQMTVFKPGDRFVTISEGGRPRVYEIQSDGHAIVVLSSDQGDS
jgi:hypothetical protein